MKLIYNLMMATALCIGLSACEDEKEHIFIDGNLPIKTSTLYMVGDATPNGWSIDNPTPLEATGEDPLVFTWEGKLSTGELKLCLSGGSWDAPFIRPKVNGTEISRESIDDAEFKMNAGDPDDKWKVTESGVYLLTFDLRNWKMSTAYLREADPVQIEPIEAEEVFMVGSATPAGWNIDEPTPMEKKSRYIFSYEGELTPGELKMCIATGSWDVEFIRPESDGVVINENGVAADNFVFTAAPDNKWNVEKHGNYTVELDLENWKIKVTCNEVIETQKHPIETETVFMIGNATPGGWSMVDATEFTQDDANSFIFHWEGTLEPGSFKACIERDNTFSCPFIRPTSADVEVNADGVASPDFTYTTGPDDQWKVTAAGTYAITLDLENWTIAVEFKDGEEPDPNAPIETAHLYLLGDATEGGWSLDAATELTKDASNPYLFMVQTALVEGEFKAVLQRSFDGKQIRPAADGVEVNEAGVTAPDFVYSAEPDNKWKVTASGIYALTFDLEHYTISAVRTGDIPEGNQGIMTEHLYLIGDATRGGWSLDDATALTKDASNPYLFTVTTALNEGEFKAILNLSFDGKQIRPATDGVEVNEEGVAVPDFVYTAEPDDKWKVTAAGIYTLTFDLMNFTIAAKKEDDTPEPPTPGKEPLEAETLYIIGDATPGGWSMDNLTELTRSETDPYIFTWRGKLKTGEMKACIAPDETFSCPFLRPATANVIINNKGVSSPDFVYTTDPDDKWKVGVPANYEITFNLREWTISAKVVNQ